LDGVDGGVVAFGGAGSENDVAGRGTDWFRHLGAGGFEGSLEFQES